jgi:translation initiation factor IF-2
MRSSAERTSPPVPGSRTDTVTVAQRARLVVAMGLLNIILATVALTAGIVGPTRPEGQIAEGSRAPAPSAVATAPTSSVAPTPGATDPGSVPSPSGVVPSSDPGTAPSPSAPASAAPPASEPPTVATGSTPPFTRPEPGATREPTAAPPVVTPTARPTPRATPRPTPRPNPTPEPATGKVRKAAPPCPTKGGTPPGHQKVQPPPDRPCGNGSSNGKSGGVVLVLPLLAGGLVGGARAVTRRVRPGRSPKD